jgi:hypothetical protein
MFIVNIFSLLEQASDTLVSYKEISDMESKTQKLNLMDTFFH